MKLMCNVDLINRQMSTANVLSRGKSQQACLIVAKQSAKDNVIYLILKTKQNIQGIKFKLENNIERIFAKFINDGKTTIRFKIPLIDLNIKCKNVIELKGFLHTLKLGLNNKLHSNIPILSEMDTKNIIIAPKKKIVINKKADYPVLKGFPRTTEELYISKLDRKSFDRQILRLQSLRILDMSNNFIKIIPKEVALLSNLSELYLSNNQLGDSKDSKWSWLNGSINYTLKLLDLSGNKLSCIPKVVGRLKRLLTLKLSNNDLKQLPSCIGSLSQLKYFDISYNKLEILPGSMKMLRLDHLNVTGNFKTIPTLAQRNECSILTLIEIGARLVVNLQLSYDASVIPFTLVNYLDEAQYCVCGRSCFDMYIRETFPLDLNSISQIIMTDFDRITNILFDCIFCSNQCATEFVRNRL